MNINDVGFYRDRGASGLGGAVADIAIRRDGTALPLAEFAKIVTPLLASLSQEVQDSLGQQAPFPMLNGETIRLDGAIRMAPK